VVRWTIPVNIHLNILITHPTGRATILRKMPSTNENPLEHDTESASEYAAADRPASTFSVKSLREGGSAPKGGAHSTVCSACTTSETLESCFFTDNLLMVWQSTPKVALAPAEGRRAQPISWMHAPGSPQSGASSCGVLPRTRKHAQNIFVRTVFCVRPQTRHGETQDKGGPKCLPISWLCLQS
jgi:hypothetical protein